MKGGERQLVARVLAAIGPAGEGVVVGPGDDAAVVDAPAGRLVLTVDSQREGVHFRRGWLAPADLGRRAIAVAVSDVGAMGADPAWSLCAVSAPAETDQDWLQEVFRGLGEGGRQLGCPLVGGDVSVGDRVELVITVIGALPPGREPVRRSGARPGEGCWILGNLGHAAAGRWLLQTGDLSPQHAAWLRAYRRPQPPLALGAAVAEAAIVSAMMDVSDGLGIDLERLCAASGIGVDIEIAHLQDPDLTALGARLGGDVVAWQVAGGDDYALLVAAPDVCADRLAELARAHGVPARRVGTFTDRPGRLRLLDGKGQWRPLTGGWDPFDGDGRRAP